MTKAELEKEHLDKYVIMPKMVDKAFIKWWRSLESLSIVQVRYPHERHGNAGKASNSAKTNLRHDFLQFVDAISQPNGHSTGPTFYFLPKFATI